MENFLQFLVNGLMVGGAYSLIALGLVLIFKATSIFNFAVGQMLVIGAYVAVMFTNIGIPWWLAILLSIAISGGMGALLERLTLRPLLGQPILTCLMMTIAISYFLSGIITALWKNLTYPMPHPFTGQINIGPLLINADLMVIFSVAMILSVALAFFMRRTEVGLDMQATADNANVAQSVGVKVARVFSLTWVIGAGLAALGGILLAMRLGASSAIASTGLTVIPVVLLGGLESLLGAVIAGLIIGVSVNLVAGLLNPSLATIVPFLILILVIIIRPAGLFGLKSIERV